MEKKKLQMEANKLIETSFKIPEFPVYGVWSIEARYEEEVSIISRHKYISEHFYHLLIFLQAVARWSTIKFSVRPYGEYIFNLINTR